MNKNLRFKIGDRVRIKKDLIVGARYFMEDGVTSDIFSLGMSNNSGKEATILGIANGKYQLDITPYLFTDGMITKLVDSKARSEYQENEDIESLLRGLINSYPKQKERYEKEQIEKEINETLDNGDKEEFLRLTEKYYGKSV